jgi:hypothetical protein
VVINQKHQQLAANLKMKKYNGVSNGIEEMKTM